MPNSAQAATLLETATKWRARSASAPAWARNQSRAVRALVRVSIVVKVLEITTKSVVAGREAGQRGRQIGAVDIGDEMQARPAAGIGRERQRRHLRPQIGAADADADDVGDPAAVVAGPLAAPHRRDEFLQPAQHVVHRRHDVAAVDLDRAVAAIAQRDVEGGAPLGRVDALAAEHALDPARQLGGLRQVEQQRERARGDPVLRVVEKQARSFRAHAYAARRIFVEQIPKMPLLDLLVVGFQCAVRRAIGQHG